VGLPVCGLRADAHNRVFYIHIYGARRAVACSLGMPSFRLQGSLEDLINRIVHRLSDKKIELTKRLTSDIETWSESLRANFAIGAVRT
jgi:hypothetical protein